MSLYDSPIYFQDLEIAAKSIVHREWLKGKSILVTGATGTIGSFLVDMLLRYNVTDDMDITVYAAGRECSKLSERFGPVKSNKLIYVQYDMRNEVTFDFSVDYIIHAAGNAHPMAFNSDPVGTIMGNVVGTYSLLEYARKKGTKRLLYVSSGEVYGQGDIALEAFEESYSGYVDVLSPRSCYPLSKRAVENLCASYTKQYGLETVIARPCHTYGPGITLEDSRANAQFFRNAVNGKDIVLKSAGKQMRSYCYVADCVSAIMTILINGEKGNAYNTANPTARITISDFAKVIAETVGKKVIYANPDSVDIANRTPIEKQVLSSRKVEELGWKGCYNISEGVANTIMILKDVM